MNLIFISTILILSIHAMAADCGKSELQKAQSYVEALEEEISDNAEARDVRWEIRSLERMRARNMPGLKFKLTRDELATFKKQGLQSQLQRLEEVINGPKYHGDISPVIASYKSYLKMTQTPSGLAISDEKLQTAQAAALKAGKDSKSQCANFEADTKRIGPVYDQGAAGWCYAVSTADLLHYKLNTGPRYFSFSDIALTFQQETLLGNMFSFDKNNDITEIGGLMDHTLGAIKSRGTLCQEKDMKSDAVNDPYLTCQYELLMQTYFEGRKNNPQLLGIETVRDGSLSCTQKSILADAMPGLEMDEVNQAIQQFTRWGFVREIRKNACEPLPKNVSDQLRVIQPINAKKDYALDTLDRALDSKQIAIIGYSAHALTRGPGYVAENSGPHASVVVARRFNEKTNQCEYKIRNSWGKEWKAHSDYESDNEGSVWVSKQTLSSVIMQTTYLK